MTRKLDIEKVNAALKRAGAAALAGPKAVRAGQIVGAAQARTVATAALTQKKNAKRK